MLAVVLVVALLVGTGAAPGRAAQEIAVTVPRLTSDDPVLIARVRDHFAGGGGLKVLYAGDSLVYSSASRSDEGTLASRLTARLQRQWGVRVNGCDVSLPSCTCADAEPLIAFMLAAHPHLVVYDVNIGWLGSGGPQHPALRMLGSGWPATPVAVLAVPQFPAELYLPWYRKDFSQLEQHGGRLGAQVLREEDIQWQSLQRIFALVGASAAQGVFFLPPRNRALYERYDLLDEEGLDRTRAQLARLAEETGVLLLDYTWAIDDTLFVDPVHLAPAGIARLAGMLGRDLERVRAVVGMAVLTSSRPQPNRLLPCLPLPAGPFFRQPQAAFARPRQGGAASLERSAVSGVMP